MALSSYGLAKLYAGASSSSASAKRYGSASAIGASAVATSMQRSIDEQRKKRAQRLNDLVQSGKLSPNSLGPGDQQLLGSFEVQNYQAPTGSGGVHLPGFIKGPASFLGHLGSDIFDLYKIIPGAITAGKTLGQAAWQDISHPFDFSDSVLNKKGRETNPFYKQIVAPTLAGYKETYGHGPGHFFESFYQHPLGPILDVASVASLGASSAARLGSLAVRAAEPGSALARLGESATSLTSRAGRDPLVVRAQPGSGLSDRVIPRDYTPRPLPRLFQRAVIDPLTGREGSFVHRYAVERYDRLATRELEAEKHSNVFERTQEALANLEPFTRLTDNEGAALTYLHLGVNTPERIQAFQGMVREASLGDEEVMRQLENKGVSRDYIERQADIPTPVVEKILNPSDNMVDAHRVWEPYVHEEFLDRGITADVAHDHIRSTQNMLDERAGTVGHEVHHEIQPTYVPLDDTAAGFKEFRPRLLERAIPNALHARFRISEATRFRRGKSTNAYRAHSAHNIMVPKDQLGFGPSTENVRHGTFRTDANNYLEHVGRRVAAVQDAVFKGELRDRYAVRKNDGEFLRVRGPKEARAAAGPGYTAVNDKFIAQFLRKEYDHLERVKNVVENHLRNFPEEADFDPFHDAALDDFLTRMTEADAKAFSTTVPIAAKRSALVMPEHVVKYLEQMALVPQAYASRFGRFFGKFMNLWRTYVLTLMPRWWFNTAIGSFVMNTVRGVDFTDYRTATQLSKSGLLPHGAQLTHQVRLEMTESQSQAYLNQLDVRVPTQAMYTMVQKIENYFRRAAYIHNLRREVRLQRDQRGRVVDVGDDGQAQALEDMGQILHSYYDRMKSYLGEATNTDIRDILGDPEAHRATLARTLDETNKFAYSYTLLGPWERRYVRSFIPFWGWYKFISLAAYRLPFEYPGRANILRFISDVTKEQENEMGGVPDWLHGAIPVRLKDGKLMYLSTLGLNPFSQFANPLGPEGLVGGSLQIGQFNPVIQAGLQGFGLDPMSGSTVQVSPESGFSSDFIGRLINLKTGDQVAPWQAKGGTRTLMALARAFPEFRIPEQMFYNRGASAYPESVPFIAPRLRNPAVPGSLSGVKGQLGAITGINPKMYDLTKFQEQRIRSLLYARQKALRQITRERARRAGLVP